MDIRFVLISDIYNFLDVAQKHSSEVRLFQGNYSVDGKSILGIFALNLRDKIWCVVEDGDYSGFEQFVNKL